MNKQLNLKVSQSAGNSWQHYQETLGGNIYHSAQWARTVSSANQMPLYFSWSDQNGNCVAYGVGKKRWSTVPVIGTLIKHLSLESYPIVKDNSEFIMEDVLQQLLRYAKKRGYLSLSVNSFLTDSKLKNPKLDGFTSTERLEFVIDLSLSDEQLLKNLATRHKRKAKKARKHNLVLREAETMEAMWEFRRLQVESRNRRMKRGEFIGMLDDSYYENLAKTYFKERLGRVFLLMHEDEAVSAAFVSIYDGKGYYAYGGSSDEGFKMDAPPLLFLNIFSRCRELGCSEFNLGGVPASAKNNDKASHGLYLFKSGFGGKEIACRNLYADPLLPGLGTLVKTVNSLRHRNKNS